MYNNKVTSRKMDILDFMHYLPPERGGVLKDILKEIQSVHNTEKNTENMELNRVILKKRALLPAKQLRKQPEKLYKISLKAFTVTQISGTNYSLNALNHLLRISHEEIPEEIIKDICHYFLQNIVDLACIVKLNWALGVPAVIQVESSASIPILKKILDEVSSRQSALLSAQKYLDDGESMLTALFRSDLLPFLEPLETLECKVVERSAEEFVRRGGSFVEAKEKYNLMTYAAQRKLLKYIVSQRIVSDAKRTVTDYE